MNNNEAIAVRQIIFVTANKNLRRDLRQAINVINAEYQNIDWEDQSFLSRVLTDALSSFETKGENLCR